MAHKHITQLERKEIALLLQKGYSQRDIARALSRSHTSIGREIANNSTNENYDPVKANTKAKAARRFSKYQGMKVQQRPEIHAYIVQRLELNWTPEQIAGRLKKVDVHLPYVSAKAIYKWLYSPYGQRFCHLLPKKQYSPRKQRKKKSTRELIPNRTGIELRPQEANERSELGHFEEDTIVSGKRHKSKVALAVLCDRKSLYTRLKKLLDLKPQNHVKAQKQMARGLKIKTITYDNGIENRDHEKVAKSLKIQTFFCNPYSSWEKGTVENTNGRIRRFIAKGANIASFSHQQIAYIEYWLNHTPRKCLNFKTPYEIMFSIRPKPASLSTLPGGAFQG